MEVPETPARTSTPCKMGAESEGQGPRNGDAITEGRNPISEDVSDRSLTRGPVQSTLDASDVTTGGETPPMVNSVGTQSN